MALTPDCKHDIFISYVHDDNIHEIEGYDGWVKQFYKYLTTKLLKYKKEIDIWWDYENLDRTEYFDLSIKEALDASALMICIYSRRYPDSSYCQKELSYFNEKIGLDKIGEKVNNRARIIPIFISNIHHNDWLPKLSGTSGFCFHDGEGDDDLGDPLEVDSGAFKQEMKKLRNELVKIFDDLSQGEVTRQEVSKNEISVFVSEVDDSLEHRREYIINTLKSKGLNVATCDFNEKSKDKFQLNTASTIQDVDLAIHLFSEFPGRRFDTLINDRINHMQLEASIHKSPLKLIWLDQRIDYETIADSEHKAFLVNIEDKLIEDQRIEFVRSNEANITKIILDRIISLKAQKEAKAKATEKNENNLPKVLLDTHIDDFQSAFLLRKCLVKEGLDLIFNPEDGAPQENIGVLYENIGSAGKFIFLYGSEKNNNWIDFRVEKTMQKLVELGRFTQDIFICMTPPPKSSDTIKSSKYPLVKICDSSRFGLQGGELCKNLLEELKTAYL